MFERSLICLMSWIRLFIKPLCIIYEGLKDKGEHLYFQMSVDEGLAVGDDWPFAHLQRTSFPLIFL